jgi:hypothetical protein
MILDIVQLVTTHCGIAPSLAKTLRAVYVKTTDPTFLIFGSHQAHPIYVAKVGQYEVLQRQHELLAQLSEVMPDALPKSLGVYARPDGAAISIQAGLPGIPWFRLPDRFRTPAEWLELRTRAIAQVHRFHSAVASRPEWVAPDVPFGTQLRDMARNMSAVLAAFGDGAAALVSDAANTLDTLGPATGVWQHGDFVLNNLLVDDHRLGVIDLHDFGMSVAPFHDNFSLAVSVNLMAPPTARWHHLSEDLAACAHGSPVFTGYTPHQKAAFYVSYLLFSIRQNLDRPSRDRIRSHYVKCLRDMIAEDRRFIDAFHRCRPSGVSDASR